MKYALIEMPNPNSAEAKYKSQLPSPNNLLQLSTALKAQGDEEIRLNCIGEGIYWMGERCETTSDEPERLMPMFRNITKATNQKNQKGQLFRVKEE